MEKDWPPLKECPQYKYGMINRYIPKADWEDHLCEEKTYYYSSDDEEEGGYRKVYYETRELTTFLEQVRNSRGYDVDIEPPRFMRSPFWLLWPGKEEMDKTIELAIGYITTKMGKPYEHVNTLKTVYSGNRIALVTFIAKEVDSDAEGQTFLASAFVPPHALDESELLECFLKPEGPAPWND